MSGSYEVLDAIRKGDVKRLGKALADDPAAANERDEQGVSLLLQALYHRQPEMLDLFLARRTELDAFEAAALGHLAALEAALASDPEVVRRFSGDGFTPLHLACFFGNEKTVARLLESGAPVAVPAKNPMGVLPINSAAAGGNTGAVRLLLAAGADPSSRQHGGFTALMSAATGGRREMAELLLAHGADPRSVSDDGRTAEMLARERGQGDFADWLVGLTHAEG